MVQGDKVELFCHTWRCNSLSASARPPALKSASCHMDIALPALIPSDTTFQPRTHAMEQSELERELERLHPDCWGWSLACCGRDRELAEEVLQSTYLRILSHRAKFNGGSSFKTWVLGVIRWTAREQ